MAAYEEAENPGGAEYGRVLAEWRAAGRPADVEAFIRRRANAGPHDDYPLG